MSVRVYKRGHLWWRRTVVEHSTGVSEFRASAAVSEDAGSVCVTEKSLLRENSVCFLKEQHGGSSGLPDGKIVGRSKEIAVGLAGGGSRQFRSTPFSMYSLEKQGGELLVKRGGLFGEKVVGRLDASDVSSIASEDCSVCQQLNPIYKK